MALTFVLGLLTTPVSAATNVQYVWAAAYDKDSWSITSRIIATEKPKNLVAVTGSGSDLNLLSNNTNFEAIEPKTVYATAWPGKKGLKASDAEKAYANFVSAQLTASLNTAIANIAMDAGLGAFDTDEDFASFTAKVVSCIVDIDGSICDSTVSGYKINVKPASQSVLDSNGIESEGNYQGVSSDNYRVLTLKDGREILLLVSFPKGYADGQKLSATQSNTENPSTLSWKHLVAQANKSLNSGITSANMDELEPESGNAITKAIASLLNLLYTSVRSLLGLTGMENLILNRGTRDVVYYKGICNYSWFSAANALYWVCLVISVLVIVIGIMISMIKKNLSLVNPEMRASLKEDLLKIAMCLLFLFVFQYIFYGIVELNYLFVKTLSATAPNTTLFQNYNSGLTIATLVMVFIVLWFEIKMEVTYLVRAVTILLLYITAPLFIVSMMYGKAGDKLFKTWLKELVGNIVMQSFHALILVVYLTVLKHGSASVLEKTILIYSFLPLTQFFKSKLIGDSITDGASKEAATTVGGAAMATGALTTAKATGIAKGAYEAAKSGDASIGSVAKGAFMGSLKATPHVVAGAALSGISVGAGAIGVKGNSTIDRNASSQIGSISSAYKKGFDSVLSDSDSGSAAPDSSTPNIPDTEPMRFEQLSMDLFDDDSEVNFMEEENGQMKFDLFNEQQSDSSAPDRKKKHGQFNFSEEEDGQLSFDFGDELTVTTPTTPTTPTTGVENKNPGNKVENGKTKYNNPNKKSNL